MRRCYGEGQRCEDEGMISISATLTSSMFALVKTCTLEIGTDRITALLHVHI